MKLKLLEILSNIIGNVTNFQKSQLRFDVPKPNDIRWLTILPTVLPETVYKTRLTMFFITPSVVHIAIKFPIFFWIRLQTFITKWIILNGSWRIKYWIKHQMDSFLSTRVGVSPSFPTKPRRSTFSYSGSKNIVLMIVTDKLIRIRVNLKW